MYMAFKSKLYHQIEKNKQTKQPEYWYYDGLYNLIFSFVMERTIYQVKMDTVPTLTDNINTPFKSSSMNLFI